MGRKIFTEANYDISSLILPFEDFKVFCDREKGFSLREDGRASKIKNAEALLDKKYPVLTATDYLVRFRTGNREYFESLYFQRRRDLLCLIIAEKYEGEGRFTDKIMDLVWMMLEESCWVVPAHLNPSQADTTHQLPYAYEGKRDYIDLFAGATGALIAWAWYLFHDDFDKISPVINKRILEQLHDRIIVPFTEHTDTLAWMGNGKFHWINNWCPWVTSNVLTVCALTTKNLDTRRRVVEIAFEALDKFTDRYAEDAACDEGPVYWGVACGALYNACLVLYDMSGGSINAFRDPLMKKMGEFYPKAYVCEGRFLNFSDARSKHSVTSSWGYDWGTLSDSTLMKDFWEFAYNDGADQTDRVEFNMPYRFFRMLGADPIPKRDSFLAEKNVFFPSLDLSMCRDDTDPQKGLYLSLKGHHNAASHNHLDVGNFVVFCDGTPIFIDAGVGTYTARTFNNERYTIWSMRSEYHNLPTINGVNQAPGKCYAAKDAQFDEQSGKLTLDLTNAYPAEAKISSFIRSAYIENGRATIRDELTSARDGSVTFNLLCNCEPKDLRPGGFKIHGRQINYEPCLSYDIDSPDCSWPETENIPSGWDCDRLYRIKLTAPLKANEPRVFTLTVNK